MQTKYKLLHNFLKIQVYLSLNHEYFAPMNKNTPAKFGLKNLLDEKRLAFLASTSRHVANLFLTFVGHISLWPEFLTLMPRLL